MINLCKFVDRVGQRFGRLVAVEYVKGSKWKCKCDCGNEPTVDTYSSTTSIYFESFLINE